MIEIKFPCPRCSQNIACEETASGIKVNCPACQAAVTVPNAREWQAIQPQDVFIIYRGESGGEHLARLVREALDKRNFQIYSEGNEANADQANLANLKKIGLATDVLVILTKDCFNGCQDEDDRLRQEIRHAIRRGKNIVPIFDRHFIAPTSALPADIAEVLMFNGMTPVPDLWEESMNRLVADFLNSKSNALPQRSRLELSRAKPIAIFASVVAALGIFLGIACLPQLNHAIRLGRVPNLVMVDKVTLAFVFGLNLVILGAAALAYGLKPAGLKLLNSAASGLMLANTASSVAYVVAARGYGFTSTAIAGPPALIWIITIVPLTLVTKRAGKLLNSIKQT